METLHHVRDEGRKRLYPSLTHSSWPILRRRRELFRTWLAALPAGSLDVLDVGGRLQPYRPLLSGRLNRYVAIDLCVNPLVSILADAEQLPVADERFDLVICSQMLEYASDPGRALSEIHRVLRPGGVLWLSVPSLAARDSDHDRWRFWPCALRQLLTSFSEIDIVGEGGSITGFFRTLNVGLEMVAKTAVLRGLVRSTMIPCLNVAGYGLEKLAGTKNDTFVVNYSVRARK